MRNGAESACAGGGAGTGMRAWCKMTAWRVLCVACSTCSQANRRAACIDSGVVLCYVCLEMSRLLSVVRNASQPELSLRSSRNGLYLRKTVRAIPMYNELYALRKPDMSPSAR